MEPLFDPKSATGEVLAIDISSDGTKLIAAYKNGSLILWNLVKYKLAHKIKDLLTIKDDELTSVKLLYTEKSLTHGIVSGKSGTILILRISESCFGYSHMVNTLYDNTFKMVKSISI